jgi:response regulator RpfG family c-di-GMP phosphodiesterase
MNPILLIVDDEPTGREALESVLLTQGYTLEFAGNGVETLAKARQLNPDLILLDVMMPDMDGYEVCRRLRADPSVAEVPVLMVTALDDRDSRLRGIEAGADDFISKPVDRVELRTRVSSITRLNRYRRLQDERAKLERQLGRIGALHTIDRAVTASVNLQFTLGIILQQVTAQLSVDAGAVLLRDPYSQTLEYKTGEGFHTLAVEHSNLKLGEGFLGCGILERRMICIPNREPTPAGFERAGVLEAEAFQAYFGMPILVKGQIEGLLEVFHRAPLDPDPEWLDFLESLGTQTAVAIDNARLFEGLQQTNTELLMAYEATLEGWSRAIDLRERAAEGHTQRLVEMTLALAAEMSLSSAELVHIRQGALLHDIGHLGVPDSILLKPGPLSNEEWETVRMHPAYALELLSPIKYLAPALDIPRYHHEKWDGSGYPDRLRGERIPLAARIFAAVDVWDALRSYRPAWPESEAQAYIASQAGVHFDPQVVECFLKVLGS